MSLHHSYIGRHDPQHHSLLTHLVYNSSWNQEIVRYSKNKLFHYFSYSFRNEFELITNNRFKISMLNFKDSLYNPLYSVGTIGNKSDRPTRAARTMSLFVLVFIIQWGAAAVYGAWTMLDDHIPLEIVFPVMAFSSLGGLLNGIVFLNMRIKSKRWNTTAAVTMISTKQTTAAPLGDPGNSRQLPWIKTRCHFLNSTAIIVVKWHM